MFAFLIFVVCAIALMALLAAVVLQYAKLENGDR